MTGVSGDGETRLRTSRHPGSSFDVPPPFIHRKGERDWNLRFEVELVGPRDS